jgi:hypothetical protein
MKNENMQGYTEVAFRRITGVKRTTFDKMLEILRPAKEALTAKGGPKPKLSLEDMLLATLEYLREYRTYAHKVLQKFTPILCCLKSALKRIR